MSGKFINVDPLPDTLLSQLQLQQRAGLEPSQKMPRPRRRSSGLGAEIRGDTGAPAVSTLNPKSLPSTPSLPSRTFNIDRSRPHSKRRKVRSVFRRWKDLSFRHTWVNPLVLLLAILSAYLVNPTPSNPIHSAIFLSYAEPLAAGADPTTTPRQYGKGRADFAFVAFYIIVLSFTREASMQIFIRPLAIRCGLRSRAKQSRFMEQFYTALYFSVFGPFGLYVMSRTPIWYFNTTAMFENFPHFTHEGVFKAYYLLQASYWAQQAIVLLLQLEKPRKDFKELVGHHVVTLALIWLSYRFHFTYMGLAVYITHDISDFFLAVSLGTVSLRLWLSLILVQTSKVLNYIDASVVGPYFAFFIGVWVYLRHYINLCILWATLTEFETVGPFELNWETQQYKCRLAQVITFSLLASLQAVNLFWLYQILRVAKNYVFQKAWQDVRSDNEEDEEDNPMRAEGKNAQDANRPTMLVNGKPIDGIDRRMDEERKGNGVAHANGEVKKNR
ncbi:MAG: hypothetical protein M1812_004350 [Candelaria pacifica]|nr:MAG: hypothetical protein M1812_004350 [Candelaria pacifica]